MPYKKWIDDDGYWCIVPVDEAGEWTGFPMDMNSENAALGFIETLDELAQLRAALAQAQAERDAATRRAELAENKLRDFSDQPMPCSDSDATAWVVYVPTRALDDWRSLMTRANRAEQAEAVLSEQADVITANLWHIPPEYAARNILLDVAMKMRAALAGPAGVSHTAPADASDDLYPSAERTDHGPEGGPR